MGGGIYPPSRPGFGLESKFEIKKKELMKKKKKKNQNRWSDHFFVLFLFKFCDFID